jgi:hypothetical protein
MYIKKASEITGLQKNFLVDNRPGSQDTPVYHSQGNLDYLMYFALAGSFVNQSRSVPGPLAPRQLAPGQLAPRKLTPQQLAP